MIFHDMCLNKRFVCRINAKESCSLQVGDVLLQVNGLAVDLNALDLVNSNCCDESLFDFNFFFFHQIAKNNN